MTHFLVQPESTKLTGVVHAELLAKLQVRTHLVLSAGLVNLLMCLAQSNVSVAMSNPSAREEHWALIHKQCVAVHMNVSCTNQGCINILFKEFFVVCKQT